MKRFRPSPSWLLSLAAIAAIGCSETGPTTQVLEGHLDVNHATAVRAVSGSTVIAAAKVAADGSFRLAVPPGTNYRLEVLTASGARPVIVHDNGAARVLDFSVCEPQDPYDVGGLGDPGPGCGGGSGGGSGTGGCDPGDPNCKPPEPCTDPSDPNCRPPEPCTDPMDPNCTPWPCTDPMDPACQPCVVYNADGSCACTDPSDPNCKPQPCTDPSDPNCVPQPCTDPSDPNCKPCPAGDPSCDPFPCKDPTDPNCQPCVVYNADGTCACTDPADPNCKPQPCTDPTDPNCMPWPCSDPTDPTCQPCLIYNPDGSCACTDPSDPNCKPLPCTDPTDPNCQPCMAGDPSCDPGACKDPSDPHCQPCDKTAPDGSCVTICEDPSDPACKDPCVIDPMSCGCPPGDPSCWGEPPAPCDASGNCTWPDGTVTPEFPPGDFGCAGK